MIEGDPGAPFEDEVLIRRLRWTSDDMGFAVIDAERDGDDIVLVGPIAHLEERERVHVRGIWQDDKRFGMQVKVALATPVAPSGEVALMAYLKRVKHVGGARAARLIERYGEGVLEAIDQDPAAAFRSIGLLAEARQRGDPVVERVALDARAAPAAGAARPGVAGAEDRRRVRRPRTRRGADAAVRAHECLRRRVPHRGHDRARCRRPRRLGRSPPRRGGACPVRGRARGIDVPAGAGARGQGGRPARRDRAGRGAVERDGRRRPARPRNR